MFDGKAFSNALYRYYQNLASFPLNPFYGNCEAKFSKNFKRNDAIRQRILSSSMTGDEKEDLLKQLHGLRSEDLQKLGRKALWKEFEENAGLRN